MGYRELSRRTIEEHVLHSVLFELTYRCNLDCAFCYNDLDLVGSPLQFEQYESILRELADLQVMNLILSGGEPLASPVFWPVGRLARELGFALRVKTNGHAVRGPVAHRLKRELDPYIVETSLHGACAGTHDLQTRVPGSLDRLIDNLSDMKSAGLRIRLNSTLTRWNEAEIEEMFELADRLELPLYFDPVVTPRDDGDRSALELTASDEGVERLFAVARERGLARLEAGHTPSPEIGRHNDLETPTPQSKKLCGTGSSTLAVDPYGNVYPCVQFRRSVGNLHSMTIRELWFGSAALDEIRAINERARAMIDALGSDGVKSGFCIGLAAEHGDPSALYPDVERRLETLRRVESEERPGGLLPILGQ